MTVFRNPDTRPINESTSVITSAKASATFRRLVGYFQNPLIWQLIVLKKTNTYTMKPPETAL